mgnify:CR=1 FL=1
MKKHSHAKVFYFAVDLHYLREYREYQLNHNPNIPACKFFYLGRGIAPSNVPFYIRIFFHNGRKNFFRKPNNPINIRHYQIPLVTTSIGAEGLSRKEGFMEVEDDASGLAGAICRLYEDFSGLRDMSDRLLQFIILHKTFYKNIPACKFFYLGRGIAPSNVPFKVFYFAVDLHYLREYREYQLNHNPNLLKSSEEWKEMEYGLFRKADVGHVVGVTNGI